MANIAKKSIKMKFFLLSICGYVIFAPRKKLRGGAVVARWAHNPKVGGSNPPSATKKKALVRSTRAFSFSKRAELARASDGNEKARCSRLKREQGFFFVKHPLRGSRGTK